ncbi:hypothetical protein R3P38DRAFT_2762245 [Favolaschia claudopus]|uniref:Uncharacterized protein n=1 Tax=Favolaschia claudopus TaxID=2862362 RepID=A0AAW0DFS6_9AGAR
MVEKAGAAAVPLRVEAADAAKGGGRRARSRCTALEGVEDNDGEPDAVPCNDRENAGVVPDANDEMEVKGVEIVPSATVIDVVLKEENRGYPCAEATQSSSHRASERAARSRRCAAPSFVGRSYIGLEAGEGLREPDCGGYALARRNGRKMVAVGGSLWTFWHNEIARSFSREEETFTALVERARRQHPIQQTEVFVLRSGAAPIDIDIERERSRGRGTEAYAKTTQYGSHRAGEIEIGRDYRCRTAQDVLWHGVMGGGAWQWAGRRLGSLSKEEETSGFTRQSEGSGIRRQWIFDKPRRRLVSKGGRRLGLGCEWD